MKGSLASRLLIILAVLILVAIWTIPTLGLLITSFRERDVMTTSGWWSVFADPAGAGWTTANYATVLNEQTGIAIAFINSLTVTIPAVVIPILVAAFAAYGFAWMRFSGRKVLFAIIIMLLVVPIQIALIPVLKGYLALDLNGTYLAMWLAHTGFGLALATYLLHNYISELPRDILESAFIDGASHFTTFTRLILPLSVPALASFAIFQFLWVWNDLLVAQTFLGTQKEVAVITSALLNLIGTRAEAWHLLTAGAFVSMVLPLAGRAPGSGEAEGRFIEG
ncbi:MAG: Sugar transporter permease [Chloroflexi bacterium]|nr:Sugar transporter permease [Chloroflexota bacterium]